MFRFAGLALSLPLLVLGQDYEERMVEGDLPAAELLSIEGCADKLPEGRRKNFLENEAIAFKNSYQYCYPGKRSVTVLFFGKQGELLGNGENIQLPDLDGEEMLAWLKTFGFVPEKKMAVYKTPTYKGKFDGHQVQLWALEDTFNGAFEQATIDPHGDMSGYLLQIGSKEEREFVDKILEENLPGQNVSIWVGAHNTAPPGEDPEFRFLGGENDGARVNFDGLGVDEFHAKHVPREGEGRDCLTYNKGPHGIHWAVRDCDSGTAYSIVEHDSSHHGRGGGGMDGIGGPQEGTIDDPPDGMDTQHYRGMGSQVPVYDDQQHQEEIGENYDGWRDEL